MTTEQSIRATDSYFQTLVRTGRQPTVREAIEDRQSFLCPGCQAATVIPATDSVDVSSTKEATLDHDTCGWERTYKPHEYDDVIGANTCDEWKDDR